MIHNFWFFYLYLKSWSDWVLLDSVVLEIWFMFLFLGTVTKVVGVDQGGEKYSSISDNVFCWVSTVL